MRKEILLLYAISAALAVFAIADRLSLIFTKRQVQQTKGTIVDISYAAAQTMRIYNSKWAVMSYWVNGRNYLSENRMLVPMDAEIGDQLPVRYYIDQPARLCNRSYRWPAIALLAGVVCFLIALANSR